jgi:hypothetical protein
MFDNIGHKIKCLAVFIIAASIIIGFIWFVFSFQKYDENKEFIDNISQYGSEYASDAIAGKSGMIYSVIMVVSSFISSFLLYGFGELIERTASIDDNLEEIISNVHKDLESSNIIQRKILAELEKENYIPDETK